MGGKTTQTQSNAIDPKVMGMAQDTYDSGKAIAATPFQPYTGQQVAPLTDSTKSAIAQMQGVAGSSSPDLASAISNAQTLFGFKPQSITASTYAPSTGTASQLDRSTVRDVNTGPISAEAIQGYEDPYQQQVIDSFLKDNERSREIAQVSDADRAAAAHAFGGSRDGVMRAQTNIGAQQSADSNVASLRSFGFNTALQAAQADAARKLTADQGNQGADFNVGALNTNLSQGMNLANLGFVNTAGQFNAGQTQAAAGANQSADLAGANVRLGASSTVGNLAAEQQQEAIQRAQLAAQAASIEQQHQQAQADAAYQEFIRGIQDPVLKQQLLNQTMGVVPAPQTSTSTSSYNPGLLDYAKVGAQAASAFAFSDRRLKTDIVPAGRDGKGRHWFFYRYLWDAPTVRRFGVMAQAILRSDPHAVRVHESGFLQVNYGAL